MHRPARLAGLPGFMLVAALMLPRSAPGEPPPELFAQLEAQLLQASQVRIEASVQATGALQAALTGFIELRPGNHAQSRYAGTLGGKPVELSMKSSGRSMEIASAGRSRLVAVEAESNRALLLGFTRHGLLHNLARSAELSGPDHGNGGLSSWFLVENFRPMTFAQLGDMAGMAVLGFDVLVEGQAPVGVQLWVDPETGLPQRREQVFQTPQGEAQLVETYTRFQVDPAP